MNSYLDNILTVVQQYQAEYLKTPINQKPIDGCVLPPLTPVPASMPEVELPDNIKACVPLFTAFPILSEPFSIPESCPTGISFTTKEVNIYSQIGATQPSATIPIGVSKSGDFCNYSLDIPDIVIPCFPAGPQLSGAASITVSDPNNNTNDTSTLSITQNPDIPCNWNLDGNVNINLPKIPCPSGISFYNTNLIIKSDKNGSPVANPVVSISKDVSNSCIFDINLPQLIIPCYPDGPVFRGGVSVNLLDQGNPVSSQSSSIKSNPVNSCAFTLDGDINLDIPCSSNGIGATPVITDWVIKQPDLLDSHGVVILNNEGAPTSNALIQSVPVSITRLPGNICNPILDIPPISIPCYPKGIQFNGIINFATNGGVPLANTGGFTNTIDFTNTGTRDVTKPCEWNIGTTINLPIPDCSDGITWANNVVVKLNNSTTIPTGSSGTRYQSLQLQSHHDYNSSSVNNCGAVLSGEINLGLPPFVNCSALAVGSVPTVNFNLPGGSSKSLGLTATTCGFQFDTASIDLTSLLACNAPLPPATVNVLLHNGTPLPSTSNTLSISSAACGTTITGALTLPDFSSAVSAAFNYTPFISSNSYSSGSTVSLVYPFGGKCLYKYTGTGNSPKGSIPGTPSGDGSFPCTACDGAKEFAPFQIIRCSEFPPLLLSSLGQSTKASAAKLYTQSLVKINPKSYLYQSTTGTNQLLEIKGLMSPFVLNPGEKVWIEVVLDGGTVSGTGAITPVYAALAKGLAFDSDANGTSGLVPAVTDSNIKLLTPNQAGIIATSNYITSSVNKYIGLTAADVNSLITQQNSVISSIYNSHNTRPVQFKLYILIGAADSTSTDPNTSGSLVLSQGGYGFAQGTPIVTNGVITGVSVTQAGYGYTAPPLVDFSIPMGRLGAVATGVANLNQSGGVTGVTMTAGGNGYDNTAVVAFSTTQVADYYVVTQNLAANQLLTGFNYSGTPVLQNIDYSGQGSSTDKLPALTYSVVNAGDNNYTITFAFNTLGGTYTSASGAVIAVQNNTNYSDINTIKAKVYLSTDGTGPTINTFDNQNSVCLDTTSPDHNQSYTLNITNANATNTITAFAVCPIAKASPTLTLTLVAIRSAAP